MAVTALCNYLLSRFSVSVTLSTDAWPFHQTVMLAKDGTAPPWERTGDDTPFMVSASTDDILSGCGELSS